MVLATLLSFCLPISAVSAAPLHVQLALSGQEGVYRAFADALILALKNSGIKLSEPVAEGQVDLVLAVGMQAARAALGTGLPVLCVLVPKHGYEALDWRAAGQKVASAIYMDQPPLRRLALIRTALPRVSHVGILYSSNSPELAILQSGGASGLNLHSYLINQRQDISLALGEVLEKSEVLQVLPDEDIYNAATIRNILLETYRRKVPLIGISPAYVRAGALLALYTTPEQMAEQSVKLIRQYAETGKLASPQYPDDFEIGVNMQVAQSLNLHHLAGAEKIKRAIGRPE